MSLGRRSERVRKKVDYAKFCEEEDESTNNSDDDFQDDAGPAPVKKIKTTAKAKTKTKQEEVKSKSKEPGTLKRKERLSREEKVYQRELEAALKASIRDSQQSPAENESSSNGNDEEWDISDEDEVTLSKPKKARLLPSSDVEDSNKENSGNDLQMNFERKSPSEGEESDNDEVKPKPSTKKPGNRAVEEGAEEEDEFAPDREEDSDLELSEELSNADSLSDEGDDSDFDEAEVKKESKGRGRGKSTTSPAKPGVKPRTSVTVTPLKMLKGKGKSKGRGSSANSSHSVSSSASNSPSSFF